MKLFTLFLLTFNIAFASIDLPVSFKSDFTQMITNTKNKVINYSGEVRFSNEKLFKWSYLVPTKKEVCTDGTELLVVDHDLEQVSSYYVAKGLDVSKILKEAKLHSKNIYVAEFDGKKYTIQLDSKKRLQSIAYFDDLDNKVQIVFKHIQYSHINLAHKKMQCDYPASYDIIRG